MGPEGFKVYGSRIIREATYVQTLTWKLVCSGIMGDKNMGNGSSPIRCTSALDESQSPRTTNWSIVKMQSSRVDISASASDGTAIVFLYENVHSRHERQIICACENHQCKYDLVIIAPSSSLISLDRLSGCTSLNFSSQSSQRRATLLWDDGF